MANVKSNKQPSCTYEQLEKLGVQPLKIGDVVIGMIEPRQFQTGSYGLGLNGKYTLVLPDGSKAKLQISCNCTVIDSKYANRTESQGSAESSES